MPEKAPARERLSLHSDCRCPDRLFPGRFRPGQKRRRDAMNWRLIIPICFVLAALWGCASVPTGPSISVMPGPGKPFEVFQGDDAVCRQWGQQQIGGESPSDTANKTAVGGAVLGTVVGAGLGAAVGAATGCRGGGGHRRRHRARRRDCHGFQPGGHERAHPPEAVRYRLRAVHVQQGKPGADLQTGAGEGLCASSSAGLYYPAPAPYPHP